MNDKSYRKNVGLIVLNQKNQLLVCKRMGKRTWQFPQGGIDEGESELKAAYRELYEEVGIKMKSRLFTKVTIGIAMIYPLNIEKELRA